MPNHAGQRRATFLFAAIAGALGLACANAAAPPGGPPDLLPPVVVSITPGSGQTGIQPREVVLQFDEVISETPRGAQDLGSLVFISPKSGVPRVSWNRTRINIRPRDGFKPNVVYSVEVRPGIMDLRSNVLDTAVRIVFSTGGEIPQTRVSGVLFDWVAGRPAVMALVEAIAADSTTYQTLTDSSGRYSLQYLPTARYVIRGVLDRNNNRDLEPLEPWDSTSLVVTADVTADLYAFQHDTLPMRLQSITYVDSVGSDTTNSELRLMFDKPFAPGFALDPAMFQLVDADSNAMQITRIVTGPERRLTDSLDRVRRADSAARAQRDTTAAGRARADSLARRRTADSLAAAARIAEQRRAEALRRGGRPAPVVDTLPTPVMARPMPISEIILVIGRRLQQGATYRLSATGLRSLSGTVKPTPSRSFIVPRRAPPRDTTRGRDR